MMRNGRPCSPRPQPQLWTATELETFSRHYYFLDTVMSKCFTSVVPLLADAIDALKQQLVAECSRVRKIRTEKKRYADAYNRFVLLQKELQERERKIEELAGILGVDRFVDAANDDSSSAIGEVAGNDLDISQLRHELPIWKAIRWYIGHVGEARINDVLAFLAKGCGFQNANRNGVESALRLHPETFNIRMNKREKFISLKGG